LSHQEVAPLARVATDEMADQVLRPFLAPDEDEVETGDEIRMRSQGKRWMELFERQSEELLSRLGDKERKALVGKGSVLGRKWISAIP
jgi:hypothetical protein